MSDHVIVPYKDSGVFECSDCKTIPEWDMQVNKLYNTVTWLGKCQCENKVWSSVVESVKVRCRDKSQGATCE